MASLLTSPYNLDEATKKSADVNTALESALESVNFPKNIDVITNLQPSLLLAQLDPFLLKDIFFNVMKNAKEAMANEGGQLQVISKLSSTRSDILVTIADSGQGIPREMREKLFKPFSSTKSSTGGMGMALFNAYNILQAIGGNITLEDSDEPGARFIIRIPLPPLQVK